MNQLMSHERHCMNEIADEEQQPILQYKPIGYCTRCCKDPRSSPKKCICAVPVPSKQILESVHASKRRHVVQRAEETSWPLHGHIVSSA